MTRKEFVDYWKSKLLSEGIKIFPDDFLDNFATIEKKIPAQTLILGSELFGSYEVITTSGEIIFQTEDFIEAKYYVYSSQQRKSEIKIPVDKNLIPQIVKKYEQYIDNIITEVTKELKKTFPDTKEINPVSEILKALNLVRY
ncbi:hypothetical protein [Ignavibacterium sp.]|uniref:hypothetical protein n=1 Tax=Ignavibacterium sp. TaxID=2651167 RepID=UPI00307CD610